MSEPARHERPYCLICGSQEVATNYESSQGGRKIDETETLRTAAGWLADFLAHNVGTGESNSAKQEMIAETIADLYSMANAREEQEKEEDQKAAQPQA
jgi:hypothetical protein